MTAHAVGQLIILAGIVAFCAAAEWWHRRTHR